jgi:hypothetical protein
MRYLYLAFLFCSLGLFGQSQGVTNSQTKLRPNQLRWSPTDATLDSVYIIRADTATGEPGWYLVTLGGSGGGVADTTLSGDVIGGLNSTFVRKINGVTVENKTPQNREVLTYNGTQWTPDSIDLADLPTLAQSVLLGRGSASTGVPQAISLGTGLSMSGTTLSNSAPDQTVTISGATGTYPNFTVTPTSPAGSSMQVQYNNAGSFGALDSFTVSANPDRVGIGVPTPTARLDIQGSGSTSATNALRVRNSAGTNLLLLRNDGKIGIGSGATTPTGDIHIERSSPNITLLTNSNDSCVLRLNETSLYGGFLKLKASTNTFSFGYNVGGTDYDIMSILESATTDVRFGGSSGVRIQPSKITLSGASILEHSAGVGLNFSPFGFTNAMTIRQTNGYIGQNITNPLAGFHNNFSTVASTPSMLLSGTGFSGGTSTTTKPTLLIEPTGTTSTGWSTSGTKLGVNAESGFTGNLLDLQLNGTSKLSIASNGNLSTLNILNSSGVYSGTYYVGGSNYMAISASGTKILYGFDNVSSGFRTNSTEQLIISSSGLLQLQGTTSSYPALKRNGTGLDVRLADDSGYTAIQTLYDRFGSGSPESVVTAPVGAVYHRTDGGAGTSLYVKESGTGNTGWIAK